MAWIIGLFGVIGIAALVLSGWIAWREWSDRREQIRWVKAKLKEIRETWESESSNAPASKSGEATRGDTWVPPYMGKGAAMNNRRSEVEFYREANAGKDHRARVLEITPPVEEDSNFPVRRAIGRTSEGYEDRIDAKKALRYGAGLICMRLGDFRGSPAQSLVVRKFAPFADESRFGFTIVAMNGEPLLVQGPVDGYATRAEAERDLLLLAAALLEWVADGEPTA
jgi:uncharacterized protein YegP (UPF0339 family)